MKEKAYIRPPEKIPFYIKLGLMISKKVTKKDLLVPKLLAWYPKVAISSGVLESLVAHGKKDLSPRMLKLVRMQASILPSCPFCIDMNSFEYEKSAISEEEINALTGRTSMDEVHTFSKKERLAVTYTQLISKTPVMITDAFMEEIKAEFTEREIVILASTAAQVNYWARLISALGVPPAGFTDRCDF
ncbi:carboxymuconolactone decarboxylase family protein [Proteiniclasticum sp. C24MP]|uniref:carboxymuconolactone decarboxylase family protein n=1 Tax=Proteiniclasticum sp. C24MP TaxID=3374101 RepID=UPI0037544A9C